MWRKDLVENLEGDILEIGIGKGENLPYYKKAKSIVGFEPDIERAQKAIEVAETLSIPIRIDTLSAEKLPYQNAAFDAIVSSLVFCSVSNPNDVLRELKRVLRSGGYIYFVEHIAPNNTLLLHIARFATIFWKRMFNNCHWDRRTIQLFKDHGWRVEIFKKRGLFVMGRAQYK